MRRKHPLMRGGSWWFHRPRHSYSAYRISLVKQNYTCSDAGFRVVAEFQEGKRQPMNEYEISILNKKVAEVEKKLRQVLTELKEINASLKGQKPTAESASDSALDPTDYWNTLGDK